MQKILLFINISSEQFFFFCEEFVGLKKFLTPCFANTCFVLKDRTQEPGSFPKMRAKNVLDETKIKYFFFFLINRVGI